MRRNIFKIPSGKACTSFVRELAHLYKSYADSSVLESIILYAVMVMPHLLLQRPLCQYSSKQTVAYLERRLSLWSTGDINSLLKKGRAI